MVPIKLGLVGPGNILQINMLLEFSPFNVKTSLPVSKTPHALSIRLLLTVFSVTTSGILPSALLGSFVPAYTIQFWWFGGLAGCCLDLLAGNHWVHQPILLVLLPMILLVLSLLLNTHLVPCTNIAVGHSS